MVFSSATSLFLPTAAECSASGGFHLRVTPLGQILDVLQDVFFGCQKSGTEGSGKAQQLRDLSFSRTSEAASKELREQEIPLCSPDTRERHPVQGKLETGVSSMNLTLGYEPEHGKGKKVKKKRSRKE